MLKPLVLEKFIEYFKSDQWVTLARLLDRGKEVIHAHLYVESILHPLDVAAVLEKYFSNRGLPLQRAIKILSQGRGITNIYNIHPRLDMAHFEFVLNFNEDVVLEPAKRRAGNLESWDTEYMKRYYAQFSFREPK